MYDMSQGQRSDPDSPRGEATPPPRQERPLLMRARTEFWNHDPPHQTMASKGGNCWDLAASGGEGLAALSGGDLGCLGDHKLALTSIFFQSCRK
jgi:hypothetical protein